MWGVEHQPFAFENRRPSGEKKIVFSIAVLKGGKPLVFEERILSRLH
jgi:hypothetical protein